MEPVKLLLHVPGGFVTATSLGVTGFAEHRSPGSGKYFQGRAVLVELAIRGTEPAFVFLEEGGWRDAGADTRWALAAAASGKRTKTALSNNAFSCTPLSAWERVHLVKTGGEVLDLGAPESLAQFSAGECGDDMTPDDVARAAGIAPPPSRTPRLYMTLAPIEMLVFSNLTPEEFTWYTARRRGKVFRQVAFAELRSDPGVMLAAELKIEAASREVAADSRKKTKTVIVGDSLGRVPYRAWIGYERHHRGGLYTGDGSSCRLWPFPERIPRNWENAW